METSAPQQPSVPVSPATPTPPVGPNRLLILKQAGFPDDQIQSWAAEKRQVLSEAGFSGSAIEGWLTGVTVSDGVSPGLANRVSQTMASGRSITDQATRGDLRQEWERALNAPMRTEPNFRERLQSWLTGPSFLEQAQENDKQLRQLYQEKTGQSADKDPVDFAKFQFNDPDARKLSFNNPWLSAFTPGEGLMRSPVSRALGLKPRLITAEDVLNKARAGGGYLPSPEEATKMATDVNQANAEGRGPDVVAPPPGPKVVVPDEIMKGDAMPNAFPLARTTVDGIGTEHEVPIGRVPKAQDFVDATHVIAGTQDVPHVTQKLLTLYHEHGIHPAEVVRDASNDVTVAQAMLSKGDDLPVLYRPEGEGGGSRQPPEEPPSGATQAPRAPPPPEEQAGAAGGQPPALPPTGGPPAVPSAPSTRPPPPPGSVEEAEEHLLSTMSIGSKAGEREGRGFFPRSFSEFYTDWVNKYFPVKQAVVRAQRVLGRLPTWENPYELIRLFAGYAGKARHMIERSMMDFDSYANIGPSLQEILGPHKKDLNGLRAFLKAIRSVELDSRGIESGVDIGKAKLYAQERIRDYGETAAKLIKYQNDLAAYLRDSGVLSQKGFAAMLEANKLYVPFSRLIENEHEPTFRGGVTDTLQPQNPIERIKGSDEKTIDPLETIIRNTYVYTAMAEKNAIGRALIDMLKRAAMMPEYERGLIPVDERARIPFTHQIEAMPDRRLPKPEYEQVPALYDPALDQTVRDYLKDRGLEDQDDLVAFIRTASRPAEGNEIRFFRDGKVERYLVDPELARAVQGLDRESMGVWAKVASMFASGVRAGAVMTPDFWGRHIIRDFQYAFVTWGRGIFNPADMVRGVWSLVRKDEAYWNWLKSGGSNISFVSLDRRYLQDKIDDLTNTGLLERAWNVVRDPTADWHATTNAVTTLPFKLMNKYMLDPLRMATEFAENASHMGAFIKAQKGIAQEAIETGQVGADQRFRMTKPELQYAGFLSRDIAVDAAVMGANMRAWNAMSAFANITIQDTDRVARAFMTSPASTALKVSIAVTLPSVLLWAANNATPERAKIYRNIPDWQRDLFWLIILDVGNAEQGVAPTIFRIPKPWGMGLIFGTIPEKLLDAYATHDPDAGEKLREQLMPEARETIKEKLLEIPEKLKHPAFEVMFPSLLPNFLTPILEQYANRSTFTDRTLIPANLEGQLPEYEYTPYTTELAKKIGSTLGAFPGMKHWSLQDSVFPGGVAHALTSPILLENYIREWTGTGGMYLLQATDWALRKRGILPDPVMPARTLSDLPFIKAFTIRYPTATAQSIQDFQDAYRENKAYFDTWNKRIQDGDAEAALRLQQAGADPGTFALLQGIDTIIRSHSEIVRNIFKNPEVAPDEKRQIIDTAYFRMIEAAEMGMAQYKNLKAGLEAMQREQEKAESQRAQ